MLKRCTMTELLSKINLTKKKIENGLSPTSSRLINARKKSETNINGCPIESIEKDIVSAYTSVSSLIHNYKKLIMIKNSVNAIATVKIAGDTLTITEALAYNTTSVKNYYRLLLNRMASDYNDTVKVIADYNKIKFSDNAINSYLSAALGGIATSDMKNIDSNTVEELLQKYHDQNDMVFIDPLNLIKEINKLENWYNEFYDTVNFKLSEVNSRLIIEYDLDSDVPIWRIVNLEDIKSLEDCVENGGNNENVGN